MKLLLSASAATLALGLAAATQAQAAGYNFETLTVPGATLSPNLSVSVYAINDLGQAIVNASQFNVSYNYTVVNDLYNLNTMAYTPLPAYPGATTNSTAAFDINNSGVIVGDYHTGGIEWGGYSLSSPSGGVFTPVTYPSGSSYSYPTSISNNGNLTGSFDDGVLHGYVQIGGTVTQLDTPSAWGGVGTFPNDINDSGTVVGEYFLPGPSADYNNLEPFLWSNGVYTKGVLPAGYAYGSYDQINDEGVIVGYATNNPVGLTDGVGFIDDGGVITTISDPLGVNGTYVYAINNEGEIGGTYIDGSGDWHAFVATPVPEASTWAMMLAGFAGLGFTALRSRRQAAALA